MASFSRYDLAKGYSVDTVEVREIERRQFFISALLVVTVLCFSAIGVLRATVSSTYKGAEAGIRVGHVQSPIQTRVRYVDRSNSDHRLAVASTDD
jgi:hypothetical protein